MISEIKLETSINNAKEAKILEVCKKSGDVVNTQDVIFLGETNKCSIEICANVTGIIESILVQAGDTVKSGDVLATINGEKTDIANNGNQFDYFSNLLKPQKMEFETEIAIIGGGPGGYVAAIKAAKQGAKVILIEKGSLGGTCLNRGCIPTKSLVRSAEIYSHLNNADHYGCHAANISLDMAAVINRKNSVVSSLVQGIQFLMDKNKIKIVYGTGELLDNETVLVRNNNQEITVKAQNIIIATGSIPAKLPIPGIELENVMDSDQALQLSEVPNSMVIVGGGVIGMEFAFIYANFGVKVSVIEFLDDILVNCDPEVCEEIGQIAASKGIKIYKGSALKEIKKSENGQCIVSFAKAQDLKFICSDKVLMATGRQPEFSNLGLEKLGIALNENGKGIKVNDKMQTNIPNIYAIGDVTNKIMLAHVASHQGIIAVRNIMGDNCKMDYEVIPSAIFTDPEIAMVGITERIAQKTGIEIAVGMFPLAANGKTLTYGETRGFVKIIKDKSTDRIIGGAIIGPHATDLIGEIALAIRNNLSVDSIIDTIHAHPTTSEAIHEAALSLEGQAIHYAN